MGPTPNFLWQDSCNFQFFSLFQYHIFNVLVVTLPVIWLYVLVVYVQRTQSDLTNFINFFLKFYNIKIKWPNLSVVRSLDAHSSTISTLHELNNALTLTLKLILIEQTASWTINYCSVKHEISCSALKLNKLSIQKSSGISTYNRTVYPQYRFSTRSFSKRNKKFYVWNSNYINRFTPLLY